MSSRPSVGLVVPTLNAASNLRDCLLPFSASPICTQVLVVDSSSDDATVDLARSLGAETIVIPRQQFNHGTTRELARKAIGTDIVVMATQDIIPTGPEVLERLVEPIVKGIASVSYARQIPHDGADFFEEFPRSFNYPSDSQVRSLADLSIYGVYTFFCSDSCAAWSNAALDSIGGFPRVLTAEDTIATAKLIHAGHKIAYVADAIVKHSHRYSLVQEFQRAFDTGFLRHEYRDLLLAEASDERRGMEYTKSMFSELCRRSPSLLPKGLLFAATKYVGYRLGTFGGYIPRRVRPYMSAQRYYWLAPNVVSEPGNKAD